MFRNHSKHVHMCLYGTLGCIFVIFCDFHFFRYVDTPYAPAEVDKYIENCSKIAQNHSKSCVFLPVNRQCVVKKYFFGISFCFIGCNLPLNWRSRRNFEKKMKIENFRSKKSKKKHMVSVDICRLSHENRQKLGDFLNVFCF